MTPRNRPLLAALVFLAAGTSSAEIFRCTARDGGVTYQQDPCAAASAGAAVNIPTSFPEYSAERDRLMQREAAMDERLLRRLEIEAAERIARDDRVSREKEAQAERDRLESTTPTYVLGVPVRSPWRSPRRAWPSAGVR